MREMGKETPKEIWIKRHTWHKKQNLILNINKKNKFAFHKIIRCFIKNENVQNTRTAKIKPITTC